MEISVWIQRFVQVVSFVSNLFVSSRNQNAQNNGTVSPNAPAGDAALILTSSSATVLAVVRDPSKTTSDGVFGEMKLNGETLCVSCENRELMIPEGTYKAKKDMSPRLGYVCPHLEVPSRDEKAGGDAGIRIHILNDPNQSEGCIGAGSQIDGDSIDNSRIAFNRLMIALPEEFAIKISSI
jgi:hypothetical protein